MDDIRSIIKRLKNVKSNIKKGLTSGDDWGLYVDEAQEELSDVIKALENKHTDDGR